MTEVLYCPVSNEFLLFYGLFEIDTDKNLMTLYVHGNRNKFKRIDAKQLIHIGWL